MFLKILLIRGFKVDHLVGLDGRIASEPSFHVRHPLLRPPDLPVQPRAALPVVSRKRVQLGVIARDPNEQLLTLVLKRPPLADGPGHGSAL
jgi:hypothetical protein